MYKVGLGSLIRPVTFFPGLAKLSARGRGPRAGANPGARPWSLVSPGARQARRRTDDRRWAGAEIAATQCYGRRPSETAENGPQRLRDPLGAQALRIPGRVAFFPRMVIVSMGDDIFL